MTEFLLFLASLQVPAVAPARPASTPASSPVVVQGEGAPSFVLPRFDDTVVVDGRLDEAVWSKAVRLTGFSEYRPVDGQPASDPTDVLAWYSPSALYFGIIAHDSSPGSVRATVADRDNLDRDDTVRIFLDTFNDRRRAFIFGVNPLGVQEDGVQTEGAFTAGRMFGMNGNVDLSPDYQFDSKGQLTPEGYVVEVRIPFKSLRYPPVENAQWGLNFLRKTQRTGREDTWTDARRVASFLAQAGTLSGLHDVKRGVVTELQPFVTGAANGARNDSGEFSRGSTDVSPGANVRFGFTTMSLDATVNPDFSQVESDASQVTVNERFALFFPEKRPFFLEGIELFATPNQLVYTRRIVDPIAGGKVTGKMGKTGVAFLSAVDDLSGGHAWVNIARVRQDIGADSLAGVTYTDRTTSSGFNRVVAADARIVFKKLYYVLGQMGGSWTETNGRVASSPMWQAEFDRTARTWGFNYKATGFGSSFDAQSGFVPRNDVVLTNAYNRLTYYGARGSLLESLSAFGGPTRVWRYEDFGRRGALEGEDSVNVTGQLRGGWMLSVRGGRSFAHFDPDAYATYTMMSASGAEVPFVVPDRVTSVGGTYSVTTPVFQKVNGRFEISRGGIPIFAEASDGRQTRMTASLGVRPTASVRGEVSLVRSRITRERDGSEFARSTIPRVKVEYQPRRSLFFRVIAEYRSEAQDALFDPTTGVPILIAGDVAGPIRVRGLRMDWLASYEPTPGTVAFFGYGSSYQRDPLRFGTEDLRRTTDGFFVKIAYLIRR